MRKKFKRRKFTKLVFSIIIIAICYLFISKVYNYFKNNGQEESQNNKIEAIEFEIIDSSESDYDIINEYFASGMDVNDFKNILSHKANYVEKSTHEYGYIEYNFEKKLHYSEIEDYFYQLNYSDIVKLEILGKSVDNRNIYSVEIGSGEKELLIDANIHSAEIGSTLMTLKYMIDIVNKYENKDSEITELLNNYKIVIVPSINPDGYEIYNYGVNFITNKDLWIYVNRESVDFENFKFNANGIDINRNMPTENAGLFYKKYDLIKSASKEKTTLFGVFFGGKELGSEPETKALMYFMLKHYKKAIGYINMHSQGRIIYEGKPNLSDKFNNVCNDFAKFSTKYNSYQVLGLDSEEVGQGNDGSATDFMSELANGLVFSSSTGRLSMNKYENINVKLVYEYPVVTIETLNTYTRNPEVFKNEYYEKKFYDMFTNYLKNHM